VHVIRRVPPRRRSLFGCAAIGAAARYDLGVCTRADAARAEAGSDMSNRVKVVVYVPASHADAVRKAMGGLPSGGLQGQSQPEHAVSGHCGHPRCHMQPRHAYPAPTRFDPGEFSPQSNTTEQALSG